MLQATTTFFEELPPPTSSHILAAWQALAPLGAMPVSSRHNGARRILLARLARGTPNASLAVAGRPGSDPCLLCKK